MHRRSVAVAAVAVVFGSLLFFGSGSTVSAQEAVGPSVVADAECSPDDTQQGIVFTFINGNVTSVTITGATVSGTLLGDPQPITFDPLELKPEETAQADIVVPGDAAGSIEVEVTWVGDNETTGSTGGGFDVTACAVPVTTAAPTTTAAPAVAADATASFTG